MSFQRVRAETLKGFFYGVRAGAKASVRKPEAPGQSVKVKVIREVLWSTAVE